MRDVWRRNRKLQVPVIMHFPSDTENKKISFSERQLRLSMDSQSLGNVPRKGNCELSYAKMRHYYKYPSSVSIYNNSQRLLVLKYYNTGHFY